MLLPPSISISPHLGVSAPGAMATLIVRQTTLSLPPAGIGRRVVVLSIILAIKMRAGKPGGIKNLENIKYIFQLTNGKWKQI